MLDERLNSLEFSNVTFFSISQKQLRKLTFKIFKNQTNESDCLAKRENERELHLRDITRISL